MAQYIDKAALIALIDDLLDDEFQCNSYDEATGFQNALTKIKEFINTLKVKEVDLDSDIRTYLTNHFNIYKDGVLQSKKSGLPLSTYDIIKVAEHFFELGLQVNNPITAVESTERHLKEPTIVYVVSRSEEHSDYVEEVFLDESKAKKYCDQFKGDENEYVRYITKVKLTL